MKGVGAQRAAPGREPGFVPREGHSMEPPVEEFGLRPSLAHVGTCPFRWSFSFSPLHAAWIGRSLRSLRRCRTAAGCYWLVELT